MSAWRCRARQNLVTDVAQSKATDALDGILDDVAGDDADKPRRQLELVNDLLVKLRRRLSTGGSSAAAIASGDIVDLVASPLRVLRAVKRDQQFPASPEIGLAVAWLFTAGKGSPSLLQEIRRELASSDQVDILVSFITVSTHTSFSSKWVGLSVRARACLHLALVLGAQGKKAFSHEQPLHRSPAPSTTATLPEWMAERATPQLEA